MAKDLKQVSRTRAIVIAQRMASGWEDAVGDSKGELTPQTRLLVGMRGALGAVMHGDTAGWIAATLTQALAELGVTEDPELHLPSGKAKEKPKK